MTNGRQESATSNEMSDFASDCNQWGRYNVHYLEPDGEPERTNGSGSSINVATASPAPAGGNAIDHKSLRSKPSNGAGLVATTSGPPRSIKRHGSDAGTRSKGVKNRNRVSRRQSEGPAGPMAARCKLQQSSAMQQCGDAGAIRLGSSASCLEPCLRLSIIHRHENDLRKKRVAFSDAPAVVWNDPPVILFSASTAGNNSGRHPATHSSALASYHRRHSYPTNSLLAAGNNADGDACPAALKDGHSEEYQQQDQGEEVLTPKERRRRKVVMAVVCTTFILLMASALFVLISLFHASAIDEAVRKENELQTFTSVSSNGDMIQINGTASSNVFSPQQTGQLGTILNSTTTAATPGIIAILAASNSSTMT